MIKIIARGHYNTNSFYKHKKIWHEEFVTCSVAHNLIGQFQMRWTIYKSSYFEKLYIISNFQITHLLRSLSVSPLGSSDNIFKLSPNKVEH